MVEKGEGREFKGENKVEEEERCMARGDLIASIIPL